MNSATGAVAWVVQIGGLSDDVAYDVAVSPSGDAAYVAGSFRAQCQFGPSSAAQFLRTSRGEYDAFVAKVRRQTPLLALSPRISPYARERPSLSGLAAQSPHDPASRNLEEPSLEFHVTSLDLTSSDLA